MIYFTSDTHFYHSNIISYCNRPFGTVEEMNKVMIDNWNAIVHADDLVYHLGDLCFGNAEKHHDILQQLAGNIIFILGNHDRRRRILEEYHPVYKSLTIKENGLNIFLRHKPLPINEAKEYDLHLCGHVHHSWIRHNNIINVGVDLWEFQPRTLVELCEEMF